MAETDFLEKYRETKNLFEELHYKIHYKISFLLEKSGLNTEKIFFAKYPNILVFFLEGDNTPIGKSASEYTSEYSFIRRRVIFEKCTNNVSLSSKLKINQRAFACQTVSLRDYKPNKFSKQKSNYIYEFISFLKKNQKDCFIFLYVDFDFFEELERGFVRLVLIDVKQMMKSL